MAFSIKRRPAVLVFACLSALTVCRIAAGDAAEAVRLVDRMENRLVQCRDYQYLLTSYERKGDLQEERTYRFYVKDARLVRIKIVAGRGKGSEAILDAQGRVWGRKGGLLKAFPRTLSPDDRRICSLCGTPFWDAACHNYLKALRARMAQAGMQCEVGPDREQPGLLLLEVQRSDAPREKYWIDPQLLHIVKGEVFEGDVLVRRFAVSEIKENVGLRDTFFSF
jgi:outer membrane lipoprotein-sorting protein